MAVNSSKPANYGKNYTHTILNPFIFSVLRHFQSIHAGNISSFALAFFRRNRYSVLTPGRGTTTKEDLP